MATAAPPSVHSIGIDDIVVGERHRHEMGDVDGLAANIADIDMLQPIVVRPAGPGRYELACGARRLAAAKLNGQTDILASVRDLTDAEMVRAEFSENIHRKPFTLSEAVAIKRDLEPTERAAARERMLAGKPSENFSEGGNALDKIAKATGMHRTTLAKAAAIVDAAAAEPEKFGKLLADMDRTGRVNGIYRRLRNVQQAALIRAEPPPLPGRGPYRVGVIDPPWEDETGRYDDPSHRFIMPYPTKTVEEICGFDLSIMAPDCVLWLWATNYHVCNGIHRRVLDAWGLTAKAMLTWDKDRLGAGNWLRLQTEHCIMAVRGSPVITISDQRDLLRAPWREQSRKPPEFYDLVESLCPAPRYCDLFSRYRHNERWDCYGDQAPPPDCEARKPERKPEQQIDLEDAIAAADAEPEVSAAGLDADAPPALDADAPPSDSDWPDIPDFLRRAAP